MDKQELKVYLESIESVNSTLRQIEKAGKKLCRKFCKLHFVKFIKDLYRMWDTREEILLILARSVPLIAKLEWGISKRIDKFPFKGISKKEIKIMKSLNVSNYWAPIHSLERIGFNSTFGLKDLGAKKTPLITKFLNNLAWIKPYLFIEVEDQENDEKSAIYYWDFSSFSDPKKPLINLDALDLLFYGHQLFSDLINFVKRETNKKKLVICIERKRFGLESGYSGLEITFRRDKDRYSACGIPEVFSFSEADSTGGGFDFMINTTAYKLLKWFVKNFDEFKIISEQKFKEYKYIQDELVDFLAKANKYKVSLDLLDRLKNKKV